MHVAKGYETNETTEFICSTCLSSVILNLVFARIMKWVVNFKRTVELICFEK
jgi:hypothetical protein